MPPDDRSNTCTVSSALLPLTATRDAARRVPSCDQVGQLYESPRSRAWDRSPARASPVSLRWPVPSAPMTRRSPLLSTYAIRSTMCSSDSRIPDSGEVSALSDPAAPQPGRIISHSIEARARTSRSLRLISCPQNRSCPQNKGGGEGSLGYDNKLVMLISGDPMADNPAFQVYEMPHGRDSYGSSR